MGEDGGAAETVEPTLVQHYAGVLRRGKWLLLVCVVVAPAIAAAYALTQPRTYAAGAQVLVSDPSLGQALAGLPAAEPSDRTLTTDALLARVPAVLDAALRRAPGSGLTPDELLADSAVTYEFGSSLLDFSVRAGRPALARRLATAYAEAFAAYHRRVQRASLASARAELGREAASLRQRADGSSGAALAALAARDHQLQTLAAFTDRSAAVVQAPDSAPQISPRPARDVLLGLALGIVLGCGIVLLRDSLDTRVRSPDAVGERLGLPLLARIPAVADGTAGTVTMLRGGDPAYIEAIRTARANIELARRGGTLGTIMVTSAVAGEGKSTTAANLAVALARVGHRVALCDVDPVRPTVATLFGLEGAPGAADVALGNATVSSALIEVPVRLGLVSTRRRAAAREGRLFVMPFGRPPGGAEPTVASAVPRIVAALRQRADVVLLDAAPILLSGETVAMTSVVDSILVVANARIAREAMLTQLRRLLRATPAAKLGVVVTGMADRDHPYGATRPFQPPAPALATEVTVAQPELPVP